VYTHFYTNTGFLSLSAIEREGEFLLVCFFPTVFGKINLNIECVECEISNHVSFHPWLAGTVHVVNLLYLYWIDISVLPLNRHISVCEGVYEYL